MFLIEFKRHAGGLSAEVAAVCVQSKYYIFGRVLCDKVNVPGQDHVFCRLIAAVPAVKRVADNFRSLGHFLQNGVAGNGIYSRARPRRAHSVQKIAENLAARDIIIAVYLLERNIDAVFLIYAYDIIFNNRVVKRRDGDIKHIFAVRKLIDHLGGNFVLSHGVRIKTPLGLLRNVFKMRVKIVYGNIFAQSNIQLSLLAVISIGFFKLFSRSVCVFKVIQNKVAFVYDVACLSFTGKKKKCR